jgi:threonine/homoserine efflux transporter RhtA
VYWGLALAELVEGLLWCMLFVVGRRVGDGRLSGMGLGCVWGVIVWLVVM